MSKVKGLTISLDMDSSGVSKGLKNINRDISATGKQISAFSKGIKLDPSNLELWTKKQDSLKTKLSETNQKLSNLKAEKKALEASNDGSDKWKENMKSVDTEIQNTKNSAEMLTRQISKLESEMKKVELSQTGLGKAATKMNDLSNKAEMASNKFKKLSVISLGVAVAGTKTFASFDDQIRKVYATSKATAEEQEQLRKVALETGKTTRYTATEAGQGLEYLALAGYSVENQVSALPKVLSLASAGQMELGLASDLATDALSAWGKEVGDLTTLTDEWTAAATSSNTSVEQIGQANLVTAKTAKNLNQSMTTTNTMLGILANNGIKGAEGGTLLRNVLNSIATTSGKGKKAMDELGVSFYDSKGKAKDLGVVFKELNAKTKNMSDAKRQDVLTKIFNKRDIKAVGSLLDDVDKTFDDLSNTIANSAGDTEEFSKKLEAGIGGSLRTLKSEVEGVAISLGDQMAPTIQTVAKGVGDLTRVYNSLNPAVKKFIANGVLFGTVLAPGLFVASKALKFTSNAMNMLNTVMYGNKILKTASDVGTLGTASTATASKAGGLVNVAKGLGTKFISLGPAGWAATAAVVALGTAMVVSNAKTNQWRAEMGRTNEIMQKAQVNTDILKESNKKLSQAYEEVARNSSKIQYSDDTKKGVSNTQSSVTDAYKQAQAELKKEYEDSVYIEQQKTHITKSEKQKRIEELKTEYNERSELIKSAYQDTKEASDAYMNDTGSLENFQKKIENFNKVSSKVNIGGDGELKQIKKLIESGEIQTDTLKAYYETVAEGSAANIQSIREEEIALKQKANSIDNVWERTQALKEIEAASNYQQATQLKEAQQILDETMNNINKEDISFGANGQAFTNIFANEETKEYVTKLNEFLKSATPEVKANFRELFNFEMDSNGDFVYKGQKITQDLIRGLDPTSVQPTLTAIKNIMDSGLDIDLSDNGIKAISSLKDSIGSVDFSQEQSKVKTQLEQIGKANPNMQQYINTLTKSLDSGARTAGNKSKTIAKNVEKNAKANGTPLGADFANGYAIGISNGTNSAVNAASNLAAKAIAAAKKKQDSNSPSKVTMKLGGDFGDGYAIGIVSTSNTVANAAVTIAKVAALKLKTTLKKAVAGSSLENMMGINRIAIYKNQMEKALSQEGLTETERKKIKEYWDEKIAEETKNYKRQVQALKREEAYNAKNSKEDKKIKNAEKKKSKAEKKKTKLQNKLKKKGLSSAEKKKLKSEIKKLDKQISKENKIIKNANVQKKLNEQNYKLNDDIAKSKEQAADMQDDLNKSLKEGNSLGDSLSSKFEAMNEALETILDNNVLEKAFERVKDVTKNINLDSGVVNKAIKNTTSNTVNDNRVININVSGSNVDAKDLAKELDLLMNV